MTVWWFARRLALAAAVGAGLGWVLVFVLDAPGWFVFGVCVLTGWALADAYPPPREPQLCHMCARGLHPHAHDGSGCVVEYCECAEKESAT